MRSQPLIHDGATLFSSSLALRQFATETVAELRDAGMAEAGELLEAAVKAAADRRLNWLEELDGAAACITEMFKLPEGVASRVVQIQAAATAPPRNGA